MITEYRKNETGSVAMAPADMFRFDSSLVWLDAVNPDDEELAMLSSALGFEVPNRHDMTEIELSNRLYTEDGAHVMIANFLPRSDSKIQPPRPVAFILRKDILVTIRFADFFSFDRVTAKVPRNRQLHSPVSILCDLLDEAVSDRADNLELSMRHMETLTSKLFHTTIGPQKKDEPDDPELDETLIVIGAMGERVSNIRESIASLQRVLNYAQTYLPDEWLGDRRAILRSMRVDLMALSDEASFFMNKLSFNLDATLGMINIEETKIIRVLSIVTLVLSPPVLIAGIYGMNFRNMPELDWHYGYLFSLLLMAATAFAPILYLKHKKWF